MKKKAKNLNGMDKSSMVNGLKISTYLLRDGSTFRTVAFKPTNEIGVIIPLLYSEETADRGRAILNHDNCILNLILDPNHYSKD